MNCETTVTGSTRGSRESRKVQIIAKESTMQFSILGTIIGLAIAVVSVNGQSEESVQYGAYNYNNPSQDTHATKQQQINSSKKRQSAYVHQNLHHHASGNVSKKYCPSSTMAASEMPTSYNDKSSGFFVDMGLILTDYYGLTSSISKLQMRSIARSFTAPISSFAKAQQHQSNDVLYNSVIGLLNVLIEHTVNDTYVNSSEWGNYQIDHRVFSPMQVNDLLRKRGRLLSLAQKRDNGSDEVIRKEIAVRKMQLKIFEAKGADSINTIMASSVNYHQYRKRFAQYMWNICSQTQDRDTIRQVRNHFAFWLSQGYEDEESKDELDATYQDSDSSSFFYPEGMTFTFASGIYTLIGAILIGLFMAV